MLRRNNEMDEKKVVASVDVGRPKVLSEAHTICFKFHDFVNLKQKRGEEVDCPIIPCHGHRWTVCMYPNGSDMSDEDETHVSIFLCLYEMASVDVIFSLRVGLGDSRQNLIASKTFSVARRSNVAGWSDFVKRAHVLDPARNYLVDGTLTVEATIQVYLDKPEIWSPPNTFHRDIGRMFESKSSDVTFVVGGTQFQAHRLILEGRAPSLAEVTENAPKDMEIQIDDVEPAVFDIFLHFVHKGELPKDCDVAKNAVALLEVADKYACTSLKLVAEAELSASHITVENVIDMLLLADSKNCALLKETALAFFVANKKEVTKTNGYTQAKESPKILDELVNALANPNDIPKDVSTLRRKLYEAGLDMDGTREMLVKRLRESSKEQSYGEGPFFR